MTEATIAAGRRRNRGPLDPNRAAYIFYPLLAAAVILPVCWALFGGFKSSSELFAFPPTIWPHHWTMWWQSPSPPPWRLTRPPGRARALHCPPRP